MAVIAIILVFLLFAALGAMFSGWLLWVLWNSVVVSVFDGVNDISYWGAVLAMLVLNIILGAARKSSTN